MYTIMSLPEWNVAGVPPSLPVQPSQRNIDERPGLWGCFTGTVAAVSLSGAAVALKHPACEEG